MKKPLVLWGGAFAAALLAVLLLRASANHAEKSPTPAPQYSSVKFQDIKWQKIFPDWGDASPEIAILRVDPKTQATQLLIRTAQAMHVPRHWHSANETHSILRGTWVFECDGRRDELGPASFNYIPSKMIHQAWAPENGMLFITVDGPWDINWVDGPPQPPKKQ